jgi:hypothetical protein
MPDDTLMPKHPKRPRDPAQLAKLIVDIATGDVEDDISRPHRDAQAAALGRLGGIARASTMPAEQRKEIAQKAARVRWAARVK